MISHKLTDLLGKLSRDELKRLGDFLCSPYLNRQKYVTRLYNELVPYYPDFKDPVPLKETIYQRMYPGKPYSDTRMRNLTSDLLSLTEKFISIEAFTADKFSGELYLMEALPAKSMDDMFRRKYRKAAESAAGSNGEPRNETDYLNRLRLESARSIFVNRRLPNDARENAECYQGIVNETVKFFLASLFKNYALMLNKSTTFYKYEFDTRFIDLILWYMDEGINEYTGDTCIMLYYYFTVFYRNYDEASYLKLEEFTYNNFDKIDDPDKLNAITHMVNYCRRQSLAGSKAYEAKALGLFKFALAKGLWNQNNKLRPSVYRAIVSTAAGLGEFNWCRDFIDAYQSLQPEEHIISNSALCTARLLFEMKQYDEAIDSLTRVKPIDATYKYEADTLLIRIYYEQNQTEAYIDKVKAFKKWVGNNKKKLSSRYMVIFAEMAGYFERLIKLKLEPDEYTARRMRQEIEENKELVNRLWFLEKLDAIVKPH